MAQIDSRKIDFSDYEFVENFHKQFSSLDDKIEWLLYGGKAGGSMAAVDLAKGPDKTVSARVSEWQGITFIEEVQSDTEPYNHEIQYEKDLHAAWIEDNRPKEKAPKAEMPPGARVFHNDEEEGEGPGFALMKAIGFCK